MAKKEQYRAPASPCIFCESTKEPSGEHLFSEWMHPLLRSSGLNFDLNSTKHRLGSGPVTEIINESKIRSGNVFSTKFQGICRDCNNQWMSRIDEKTIPVLTPLLKGEKCTLDKQKIETLLEWIALKTIVGELINPSLVAISDKERKAFYHHRTLPHNFRVHIGRYNGFTGYFHRPLSLGKHGVQPDTKPQGQATTILAGDLLIHSFSGDKKLSRYLKAHSEPGILRQVHPLNSPTIRWPPHKTKSENEAFELADRYTHMLIQSRQTSPIQSIIRLGQGGGFPKCDHNGCANFSYRGFPKSNGRVEWYRMDHVGDGANSP